jgi:hypothetical protein
MANSNELGIWSWIIIILACAASVVLSELGGLRGKWEDIIVFTTLLFSILLFLYRPLWRTRSFWQIFVVTFIIHAVAISVVLRVQLKNSTAASGLLMTAITMLEALLIIIAWDRWALKK